MSDEDYVTALADVEDYEWYDPVLLDRLAVNSAAKTAIVEGEKKILDFIHQPPVR
jgi:hypothetical protein